MEALYAYTAGIIDGEGSIMLLKEKASREFRRPVISVTSTTKALIDFLYDNFGGQIICQKRYKEHHKQAWIWCLRGPRTAELLKQLLPYMLEEEKLRRAQLIVFEYRKLTPRNGKYTEALRTAKLDFEHRFFHPSAA